jgi:hypothetical protein
MASPAGTTMEAGGRGTPNAQAYKAELFTEDAWQGELVESSRASVPTGRERMGSPTLQTLQDPILLIANALGLLLRRGWSFNAFKPFRGYVTGGFPSFST